MKEIEVIIDQDGNASIELFGYNGKGCAEVSEKLAKALGKTVNIEKKQDYWKTDTKIKQKVNRGM